MPPANKSFHHGGTEDTEESLGYISQVAFRDLRGESLGSSSVEVPSAHQFRFRLRYLGRLSSAAIVPVRLHAGRWPVRMQIARVAQQ